MKRQAGWFDRENRQKKLLATKDFLDRVNRFVAWESFRPVLDAGLQRQAISHGGRPPFDAGLMFKVLVFQALYNSSDAETEYQSLDRQSSLHVPGLGLEDDVPDARTLWLFRKT